MMLHQIHNEFARKGWSLYERNGLEPLEDIVRRGPSERLQEGKEYLVLPEQVNPRDAKVMEGEVVYLTKMKRNPSIHYHGWHIPIACISLQSTGVMILAVPPQKMSYSTFYERMATLHSIKKN